MTDYFYFEPRSECACDVLHDDIFKWIRCNIAAGAYEYLAAYADDTCRKYVHHAVYAKQWLAPHMYFALTDIPVHDLTLQLVGNLAALSLYAPDTHRYIAKDILHAIMLRL